MNIARASIKRKTVILFLCVLAVVAGVMAYVEMGKLEDPSFTIKTAVVTTQYQGATATEVETEVTSRIEDAIQAMGEVKEIRSRSTDGLSIIYVDIKSTYTAEDLPQIWNVLRQKVTDVTPSLPPGASEPIVNNDFGDVFGQFYALVGDGYSMKELWDHADFLKKQLVLLPGVARVSITGDQTEAIYVEFSRTKLSTLGLSPQAIFGVLNKQNTVSAVATSSLGTEFLRIDPTSAITDVNDIGDLVLGGSGANLIRLRDVAEIRRDYLDPPRFLIRRDGRPALGIGISSVAGGNVVTMGELIKKRLAELEEMTPIGMELEEIYMQSDAVTESVNNFIINLIESVVIVIGVLLIFMGLRSGLLIGGVLVLTIAATFTIMNIEGIFLHCVSLAALIIALGSLVDNAIVVTEGILVGVQRRQSAEDAASDTVGGTVWALLGGTIIAVLAFAPIGLSPDSTGEYCKSLFQVVGISMLLSWLLAITVTPVLGTMTLKPSVTHTDPYNQPLFRAYRAVLEWCLRYRWLTIGTVLALFVLSIIGFNFVDKSFFPDAGGVYYITDLYQPQGRSIESQSAHTRELEEFLLKQPETKNVTSFIGGGALRFILTYTTADPNTAYSQLLVEAKTPADADVLIQKTDEFLKESMHDVRGVSKLFAKGSSSGPKIEARFYGDDPAVLRDLAAQACAIMEQDSSIEFVRTDWREPVKVLRPQVAKDQMSALGLTRPDINQAILTATTGYAVGVYRDGDKLLPILSSVPKNERYQIDRLLSSPVWAPAANKMTPLGAVVTDIKTVFDNAIIHRRDRSRVITAQADVRIGQNSTEAFNRVRSKIEAIPLPIGYQLKWGGEYDSQQEAQGGLSKLIVPCILLMFTITVFLFNGFKQPIIIFLCIPLIFIGVTPGLLLMNSSFSFMALLGVLSLVGMLVKNTIVLLEQVASDFASGRDRYETIVESGVSRLRPVSMSALTTVLGMCPLIWDLLFSSMAITIMFGLAVSTVLTLLFVPVLTAVFYSVPSPKK